MPKIIAERSDVIPVLAEIFREYGYEGASLSLIASRTGLGKGSLYHFFPGGKEQMASEVLREIDGWFEDAVYKPLRDADDPRAAILEMCRSVATYFWSGKRVCLIGAFALDNVRDRFSDAIRDYFAVWQRSLQQALVRVGHDVDRASDIAEDAILSIQGALVLSRAMDDTAVFERAMARVETGLLAGSDQGPDLGNGHTGP
ncbi:TetR/AcrR family transcriptional regulator [Thalassospira xiamenensis]|uniref:TetR family transcriptional regulator n=1 Tax=Thalassospira xiamenensis TaxID=220697 RepID=A0A367XEH7_9PROT|nr:TetR/AcrR family transcriptional regulator [Thalassospira xiamenensis]KZB56659.1 TetR family transcriptional regulator [Thalassospira xiamenensis]RCK29199.1 TetR family transcriptional regulator [Thalassospira xiamenensis]RCK52085.1 TetR family transcriptional regulator [Thalassospira xiamenensis]